MGVVLFVFCYFASLIIGIVCGILIKSAVSRKAYYKDCCQSCDKKEDKK
jgi:hypothetical protein